MPLHYRDINFDLLWWLRVRIPSSLNVGYIHLPTLQVSGLVLTCLTCCVLVYGDLPGVLPPPHHVRLGAARGEALQAHVTSLRLHHVGAAQTVHDTRRD